jgi:hypothetical protein
MYCGLLFGCHQSYSGVLVVTDFLVVVVGFLVVSVTDGLVATIGLLCGVVVACSDLRIRVAIIPSCT